MDKLNLKHLNLTLICIVAYVTIWFIPVLNILFAIAHLLIVALAYYGGKTIRQERREQRILKGTEILNKYK